MQATQNLMGKGGQKAENRSEGNSQAQAFIGVSVSKKEGRVNTVRRASLNNSGGLWA